MYKQIELPYSFDALEPHIDALTMETHYSKHQGSERGRREGGRP